MSTTDTIAGIRRQASQLLAEADRLEKEMQALCTHPLRELSFKSNGASRLDGYKFRYGINIKCSACGAQTSTHLEVRHD